MDDSRLDELLRHYRKAELPSPPGNLNQNVWREIRLRETKDGSVFNLDAFLNWFYPRQTSLTLSTVALAAIVSLGLTLTSNQFSSSQRTQQALGLEVFSHEASPLTRLAEN